MDTYVDVDTQFVLPKQGQCPYEPIQHLWQQKIHWYRLPQDFPNTWFQATDHLTAFQWGARCKRWLCDKIMLAYHVSFKRQKYPCHYQSIGIIESRKNALPISIHSLPGERGWQWSLLHLSKNYVVRIYSPWHWHTLEASAGLYCFISSSLLK